MNVPRFLPGDTILLDVPPLRTLPEGLYRCIIGSPASVAGGQRMPSVTGGQRLLLSLAKSRHVTEWFEFTIPDDPRLAGFGFIGLDEHPVPYQHEQNLGMRLRASLKEMRK